MYEMIDRAALKREARTLMRSAKVSPVRMSLLYFAITAVLSVALIAFSTFAEFSSVFAEGKGVLPLLFACVLISLILNVLSAGYICYCLGVHKGEKMPYSSLFDSFSFAGKVIALRLVTSLFVYLWSLLFVIPGIVAQYRYSFALYNLCQNPELGVMEALSLSKQQTNGYKMQLFMLDLNFLGWTLLLVILPILSSQLLSLTSSTAHMGGWIFTLFSATASVFLTPYITLTYTGFYLQATTPLVSEDETTLPPSPPEF